MTTVLEPEPRVLKLSNFFLTVVQQNQTYSIYNDMKQILTFKKPSHFLVDKKIKTIN